MRTKIWRPTRTIGCISRQLGRRDGACGRSSSTTNAMPIPSLRDRCSRRRAGDPPVEDVDEEDLEDEVRDVRDDDDLERPAQVRDAAEVALSCERDERRGQADRGDPEVRERVVA